MKRSVFVFFLSLLALSGVSNPLLSQQAMPQAEAVQTININTADADTLATSLNGVGVSRAAAIVAYREEHGPFRTVEELAEVDGIGAAILANNRHLLTIE